MPTTTNLLQSECHHNASCNWYASQTFVPSLRCPPLVPSTSARVSEFQPVLSPAAPSAVDFSRLLKRAAQTAPQGRRKAAVAGAHCVVTMTTDWYAAMARAAPQWPQTEACSRQSVPQRNEGAAPVRRSKEMRGTLALERPEAPPV